MIINCNVLNSGGLSMYYIGLMSGTSMDGLDIALVDITSINQLSLVVSFNYALPESLYNLLHSLCRKTDNELELSAQASILFAKAAASAVELLLEQQHLLSTDIIAIGNHGQTVRHCVDRSEPFSIQLCDHQLLACLTNIKVIGDFRQKDIVLGGQGAPLVPAFHQQIFTALQNDVVILNLGGISNITYLPQDQSKNVLGFDTGPANTLIDLWCQTHLNVPFDKDGAWGRGGTIIPELLHNMLQDPYFSKGHPKSTGRELFNLHWLSQFNIAKFQPEDVQATLTQLTVQSITEAIQKHTLSGDIYLCGGGVHNHYLIQRLKQALSHFNLITTSEKGIDADSLEAMAFAWLAYCYESGFNSNLPAVTGAKKATCLGVGYYP